MKASSVETALNQRVGQLQGGILLGIESVIATWEQTLSSPLACPGWRP